MTLPLPSPLSAQPRALTAWLMVVTTALFVGLYLLMWVPMWLGNMGWGYLYPIFLLAWLPLQVLAIVALVLEIRDIVLRRRAGVPVAPTAWAVSTGALGFVLLSLPVLWFGMLPAFLLLSFWGE
jgi:hypothetical protein